MISKNWQKRGTGIEEFLEEMTVNNVFTLRKQMKSTYPSSEPWTGLVTCQWKAMEVTLCLF